MNRKEKSAYLSGREKQLSKIIAERREGSSKNRVRRSLWRGAVPQELIINNIIINIIVKIISRKEK